ncbi:hypothetical protein [Ruminiclostridium josui]|uniref:hypothetical protein n=1 Tax=Ruminiclostridium josui TaxID=1499 RepID=UPI0013315749|nr:hypothetical protein [Ruminiclostridium josui]
MKRYEAQPGIQSFTIAEFLKIMEKQGVIDELYNDSMMDKDVIDKFLKIGDPRKVSISEYKEKAGYNVLQLAEYIDWDIDKVVSTLKKELDWIVPENSIRSTHFDCDAAEIKEYLKYKKHKITQRTIISSHLIRDDRLSREDALEILNNENHEKPEFWDEFVRRLQIEDVQI